MNTVFNLSCLLLFIESLYMALRCDYDDGILGKLWLGGIGLGAGGAFADRIGGHSFPVAPMIVFVFVCTALFMLRHIIRFELFEKSRRAGRRVGDLPPGERS